MDFATLRFSYLVGYFKWKDNDIRLSVTGFSIVLFPTIPSAQLEIASLMTKNHVHEDKKDTKSGYWANGWNSDGVSLSLIR